MEGPCGGGGSGSDDDAFGGMFGNLSDNDEFSADDDDPEAGGPEPESDEEDDAAPLYLVSAVLAGLYELPPKWLMQTQTGRGRRVRYERGVRRLCLEWEAIAAAAAGQPCAAAGSVGPAVVASEAPGLAGPKLFKTMARAKVLRHFPEDEGGAVQEAAFNVYQLTLEPELAARLNSELCGLASSAEQADPDGVDVSNAGGWHSKPFLFDWPAGGARSMASVAVAAVGAVEAAEAAHTNTRARRLQLGAGQVESWINVSRDGNWNRLHTHEGAAWSGVYYAGVGRGHGRKYSGRLVLKPTPHPAEDSWPLRPEERGRLTRRTVAADQQAMEECRYFDVEPVAGLLVMFPSWLHHAVLPSRMVPEKDNVRVSIAFNVNAQSAHVEEGEQTQSKQDDSRG